MGLDTDVRQIARAVVREELKQLEGALREGKSLAEGAAESPSAGAAAAPHSLARSGSGPAQVSSTTQDGKERRASAGRREEDRERDLLRRILDELAGLRDSRGVPRKYVARTEAQRIIGCGRTKIAELCAKNVFETFKEGKERMISVSSLERYVAGRLDRAKARRERASPTARDGPKKREQPPDASELAARIAKIDLG